nr:hypothetical protein [Corynebacterium lactis]
MKNLPTIATALLPAQRRHRVRIRARQDHKIPGRLFIIIGRERIIMPFDEVEKLTNALVDLMEEQK